MHLKCFERTIQEKVFFPQKKISYFPKKIAEIGKVTLCFYLIFSYPKYYVFNAFELDNVLN